jgi:hypothetical protein
MKYLPFLMLVIFSINSFAQNASADNRLLVKYSQDYLDELVESNPQLIDYMAFELDHGFQIIEIADDKAEGMPYLRFFNGKETGDIVEDFPDGAFNLALYSYERAYDAKTTYRLLSGKAIVFDSAKRVTKLFNDSRNEQ